jgi:hypothetical protein
LKLRNVYLLISLDTLGYQRRGGRGGFFLP